MPTKLPLDSPWWQLPFDDAASVGPALDAAATRAASRAAVLMHGREVLHSEIQAQGGELRRSLLSLGPRSPTVVASLCVTGPAWYAALNGIFTAGAAFAALEPEAPRARNLACIEEVGATVVVCDRACEAQARTLVGTGGAVLVVPERGSTGTAPAVVASDPLAPAAYLFTSGSTGRPKAVVRSHRSLLHAIWSLGLRYQHRPEDVMLFPGSPAHVGTLNDALSCLLSGFTSIPVDLSEMSVAAVRERLRRWPVTVMPMPPSMLRLWLRDRSVADEAGSLRAVIASGEALLRSDVRHFLDRFGGRATLWQNYGSTETGPMFAGSYGEADLDGEGPLPLKLPAPHCDLLLEDEAGEPVPANVEGIIRVRSRYLASGYLNASPDQAARFEDDARGPSFRIGDRGVFDAQGWLRVLGREDRQVKLHGRRIELGDVESAILADGRWREAAVVRVELPVGPRLVAVICPPPKEEGALTGLRSRLAEALPPAALPRRYVFCDALPRTSVGKLDLAAIAAQARDGAGTDGSLAAAQQGGRPRGLLESWIADAWESVLHLRPGRDARFEELGGDSVAAMELCLILEERFGVPFPIDRLIESPTVATQAADLESPVQHPNQVLVRLRGEERGPLLLLVPGIGGHAWVFNALARRLATRCDVHGVSIFSLMRARPMPATREAVASAVAEALRNEPMDRALIVAGYSFGSFVAADLARHLLAAGRRVHGVLHLDPSPRTWPSAWRVLKRRTTEAVRAGVVSCAAATGLLQRGPARSLADDGRRSSRFLVSLYGRSRPASGPVPTSGILTQGSELSPGVRAALGWDERSDRETLRLEIDHLDLLRPPAVAETAAWCDRQLARLS